MLRATQLYAPDRCPPACYPPLHTQLELIHLLPQEFNRRGVPLSEQEARQLVGVGKFSWGVRLQGATLGAPRARAVRHGSSFSFGGRAFGGGGLHQLCHQPERQTQWCAEFLAENAFYTAGKWCLSDGPDPQVRLGWCWLSWVGLAG